jgi:hypothetical protein
VNGSRKKTRRCDICGNTSCREFGLPNTGDVSKILHSIGNRLSEAALQITNEWDLFYYGRDKGMPNSWSFNWESMATGKREA